MVLHLVINVNYIGSQITVIFFIYKLTLKLGNKIKYTCIFLLLVYYMYI